MKPKTTEPVKRRLDGKKKLIALSADMEKEIIRFCAEKGVKHETELIRHAIASYITPETYKDATLKLQGLREIMGKLDELHDMIDITFKYLRLMHINLLAYKPEIDRSLADAAYASAQARHKKFFESFQDSLKNDPPFFERLLHRYYQEDGNEPA